MKKNLMILFGLVLIGLILFWVGNKITFAETVDDVAPKINSISISNTSFTPGDEITFVIDASDDISGIKSIGISFMKADKIYEEPNGLFNLSNFDSEIKNGVHTYTAKIPTYVDPDEYKFYKADIMDNAGNINYYIINDWYEGFITENFGIPNITINKYDGDNEGPLLKSLTFDKNKINAKESILVTAEVTDASDIKTVVIYFNHKSYFLSKGKDGKYTAEVPFDTPGVYTFAEIQLYDEFDNLSLWRYGNGEIQDSWTNVDYYNTLEKGKYDVTVEGVADTEKPTLTNIIIDNKTVNVPASFNIYVLADDNMDNDLEVQIALGRMDDISCGKCEAYYKGREGKKYVFQVVLGQYESPGKYYVAHVYLTDDAGNKTVYATKESPYNDFDIMKEYSFEVVPDTIVDVTTSTTSNDFMNVIKNSNNNTKISIDTTKDTSIKKEVFDVIKEKEITVNLETDGVQWIFDGKNITNSKDIDVATKISFVENYKDIGNWKKKKHKALVIQFKDNGKLPGRALIRIKADYTFRNYIGIKNLNLYYKNGKNFDLISKGLNLTKDEYYEFYLDHNSVYFLSDDYIEEEYVKEDYTETLGNNTLNEENVENGNISEEVKVELNKENKEENNLEDNIIDDNDSEDNTLGNNTIEDDKVENNKNDNKVNSNKKLYIIIGVVCLIVIGVFIGLKFIKKKK